ncbi:hypothetical protein Q9966_005409 [Columba livia]|nr:hypothetical protein Q9966_005409 [Columba livia]
MPHPRHCPTASLAVTCCAMPPPLHSSSFSPSLLAPAALRHFPDNRGTGAGCGADCQSVRIHQHPSPDTDMPLLHPKENVATSVL